MTTNKAAAAADKFTAAYIEAALWSSVDDAGEPLDRGGYELAEETRARMAEDCARFQAEQREILTGCIRGSGEYSEAEQAGHDFWLTRNHHGAGFWDGDWPEHGEALTAAAHRFGECDLYVGDDGKVYC